jgi:hypothetical protein
LRQSDLILHFVLLYVGQRSRSGHDTDEGAG